MSKKAFFSVVCCAALLGLALPARTVAQENAVVPPAEPSVFKAMKKENPDVVFTYMGRRLGFDAWLASGPNMMESVYTLPNGTGAALVGGRLFNPQGQNITASLLQDYMREHPDKAKELFAAVQPKKTEDVNLSAKPQVPVAEQLWQQANKAALIKIAAPEKPVVEVIVFLDPYQPESRVMWADLAEAAARNTLALSVVPVGVTNKESMTIVAQVLADTDPARAWKTAMKGDAPPQPGEHFPGKKQLDQLVMVYSFLKSWNITTIPFMLYKTQEGAFRVIKGQPNDFNALLQEWGVEATKN